MSKSDQPPLFMTIERGRLVPATAYDQERIDSYANGAKLKVLVWQGRNAALSRKYWAVLGKAVKDCKTPWESAEEASDALKLALGVTDVGKTVHDQFFIRPGSISFASMDEAAFRDFFEKAMAVLQRVTGVDPTTLGAEAADTGDDEEQNSDDTSSSQGSSGTADDSSPSAETEGGGTPPPPPSSDINREWLADVYRRLSAAVGPDPSVVDNQARALGEEAKQQNDATRQKASAIKERLKGVCLGADASEAERYCAGIIGIDPAELTGESA